jgi:hypothetical protein
LNFWRSAACETCTATWSDEAPSTVAQGDLHWADCARTLCRYDGRLCLHAKHCKLSRARLLERGHDLEHGGRAVAQDVQQDRRAAAGALQPMAELAPISPAAVGTATPDPAAVVPAAAVGTATPVAVHAQVKTEPPSPTRIRPLPSPSMTSSSSSSPSSPSAASEKLQQARMRDVSRREEQRTWRV